MRFAVGGCGGGGSLRRLEHFDSVWYRQLWRFKLAMAMINERLNFNQNGAWSIFREVNRLISHAPSILPLILPYYFLGTWPLLTLAHHSSLSHQHLTLLLPSSTVYPSFFPYPASHLCNQWGEQTNPLPRSPYYQAYPTIIWRGTWASKHSVSPFNISQHHQPYNYEVGGEHSANRGYSYALGFFHYPPSTSLYHGK